MAIYEIGYHLLPIVGDEGAAKEVGNIKEKLASVGANITSDEYPKMRNLAYKIYKTIDNKKQGFTTAYFGWIKFESEGEAVNEFEKFINTNKNILRSIVVKTVKEDTMIGDKINKKRSEKETLRTEDESDEEVDEEAVDKKIDEMIKDDEELA